MTSQTNTSIPAPLSQTLDAPTHAQNLIEVLHYWASETPNKEMLRFFPQGEIDEAYESRTYLEFYQRVQSIASELKPYQGQRAIMFYQSGIVFLEALFACFMCQVVAVPAYPPRRNQNLSRVVKLFADCQPSIILSTEQVKEQSEATLNEALNEEKLSAVAWLNTNTEQINLIQELPAQAPAISAQDIAFLQYTSGSTGKPKGVMVSHHNLIYNVRMAQNNFALPSDTRCISWLPLFHDMGLIGAVMMPMYWGAGSWLMPPAAFLQKPLRWITLLNEACKDAHAASAAPNFAYQLCVDQIKDEDLNGLDLSNWYFALNGSEPIRHQTLSQFIEKFGKIGFAESAMGPSYGMAECTLLASTRRQNPISSITVDMMSMSQDRLAIVSDNTASSESTEDQGAESTLDLNSSGSSCSEQTLRIVESQTVQADGHIGEIWLKGEHIAQGYWGQDALTQECFQAYTNDGQGPFLRTGDRGAVIDGELYITGRMKDMLVIRGRNLYPQDIEYTASRSHPAFHTDSAAAFTVSEGLDESLVLAQEVSRSHRKNFNAEEAATAIRQSIAREHGIEIAHIAFIRFASIPKTSSGKIQRHQCKHDFLNDGLKLEALWSQQAASENFTALDLPELPTPEEISSDAKDAKPAHTKLTHYIQTYVANRLQCELAAIKLDEALNHSGLDSIDVINLAADLEQAFNQRFDHALFIDSENIEQLSEKIIEQFQANNQTSEDNNDVEGFL